MRSLNNIFKQCINIKVFMNNCYLFFALLNLKKSGGARSDPSSVVLLRDVETLVFYDFCYIISNIFPKTSLKFLSLKS